MKNIATVLGLMTPSRATLIVGTQILNEGPAQFVAALSFEIERVSSLAQVLKEQTSFDVQLKADTVEYTWLPIIYAATLEEALAALDDRMEKRIAMYEGNAIAWRDWAEMVRAAQTGIIEHNQRANPGPFLIEAHVFGE